MKISVLEKMIHQKIPLTRQMGLRVKKSTADEVVFSLPKKPNLNHVGTVFGGSVTAAQAVACWGLYLNLIESHGLDANEFIFVLKKSQSFYKKPVTKNFYVRSQLATPKAAQAFIKTLQKKRRARLVMQAEVFDKNAKKQDIGAVLFKGEFVVYAK